MTPGDAGRFQLDLGALSIEFFVRKGEVQPGGPTVPPPYCAPKLDLHFCTPPPLFHFPSPDCVSQIGLRLPAP